jgi:hypothetical protein
VTTAGRSSTQEPDAQQQPNPSAIGCAATSQTAERKRLDLMLMVDTNYTLALAVLWPKVQMGLLSYIYDPRANGTGVGIGYFGGIPIVAIDCRPEFYQMPGVAIEPLPGNAAKLEDSLRKVIPIAGSALVPGLEGGLTYARARAADNADEADQALVLIADGFDMLPCNLAPDRAAAVAKAAFQQDPPVRTYVIALKVPEIANQLAQFDMLDPIATQGGTGDLRAIEPDEQGRALAEALLEVQHSAESCDYAVPAAQRSVRKALQVETPAASSDPDALPDFLEEVTQASDCGQGFYLAADGGRATLCPDTCAQVNLQRATLTWLSCD